MLEGFIEVLGCLAGTVLRCGFLPLEGIEGILEGLPACQEARHAVF